MRDQLESDIAIMSQNDPEIVSLQVRPEPCLPKNVGTSCDAVANSQISAVFDAFFQIREVLSMSFLEVWQHTMEWNAPDVEPVTCSLRLCLPDLRFANSPSHPFG